MSHKHGQTADVLKKTVLVGKYASLWNWRRMVLLRLSQPLI